MSARGKYQWNPDRTHFREKSQHPIRAVATVRHSFRGTLLCELGPLMESWVRWSHSGNGEALSSCQWQTCLKAGWGHSSAKLAVPHPSLAGTTPVSPDSPANVIISDKRLIGRHTMPFPLIKEHLGKTKIATKHCQQSNQQQQLAVSSLSWAEWALCREQGMWVPTSPGQQESGTTGPGGGQSQLPTNSVQPPSGEGGTCSFSACVLCFRGNGRAPYTGSYCELPSSWTPQEATRAVHLPWITLLLCLEQLYPLFNIYRQFVFLPFVRASRFQHKWLLPFLSSHYKITMYATRSLNSGSWEKYIKKQV